MKNARKTILRAGISLAVLSAGWLLLEMTTQERRLIQIWTPVSRVFAQVHQHGTPPATSEAPVPAAPTPERQVPNANHTIEIPPEQQERIKIKTATAAITPLHRTIRTVGRIEYDERKIFTVNTRFEGWIEKLYVNYTGAQVKQGQPLAEIYSPELFATQQEYLNALKWRTPSQEGNIGAMLTKDAEAIIEAARQRLRLWDISDAQIRKIEKTGKPVRTLAIYSPVSGYVVEKMAVEGMRVMPGEKLFDIVDLSTVWVIADVYEYELQFVQPETDATISLSYFPGRTFQSNIEFIYPTLTDESRTAKVRFSIPNPGEQLKLQMFTTVELEIPLGERLAIPEDAVIDTGVRDIVYTVRGEGLFMPREIASGVTANGPEDSRMVEVLRGLEAGQEVAASAAFLIDSEAKLKGVEPLPLPESPKEENPKL